LFAVDASIKLMILICRQIAEIPWNSVKNQQSN